jgi:hypothetical protein
MSMRVRLEQAPVYSEDWDTFSVEGSDGYVQASLTKGRSSLLIKCECNQQSA